MNAGKVFKYPALITFANVDIVSEKMIRDKTLCARIWLVHQRRS